MISKYALFIGTDNGLVGPSLGGINQKLWHVLPITADITTDYLAMTYCIHGFTFKHIWISTRRDLKLGSCNSSWETFRTIYSFMSWQSGFDNSVASRLYFCSNHFNLSIYQTHCTEILFGVQVWFSRSKACLPVLCANERNCKKYNWDYALCQTCYLFQKGGFEIRDK